RALNSGFKRSATAPDNHAGLLIPIDKADGFRVKLARAEPSKLVKRDWYRVRRGDTLTNIARALDTTPGALRRANGLRSDHIQVGQRLSIPHAGVPQDEPTEPYEVKPGHTLWKIAHRRRIEVPTLRSLHGRRGNTLHVGETIKVPCGTTATTYQVEAGDTLTAIARRHNVSIAQLREWNRLDASSVIHPGQTLAVTGTAPLPDFYDVKDGDTLWSIAQRFEIELATLRDLNGLGSNNDIRSGQRLRLQPAG